MAASEPDAASAALIAALLADDDAVLARNLAAAGAQGPEWPTMAAAQTAQATQAARAPPRGTWAGRVARGSEGEEATATQQPQATATAADSHLPATPLLAMDHLPTPDAAHGALRAFLRDVQSGQVDWTSLDWHALFEHSPPWLLKAIADTAGAYAAEEASL